MKMKYLKLLSFLFMTILLVAGCQKQIKDQPASILKSEDELQSRGSHGDDREECRLLSNISEFGEQTYTYNQRGLVAQENFDFFPDGNLKMEYNAKGRLAKSRIYSGDVLLNTIVFFYQDDRVVKETWYDGDTDVKTDEVFYYYNRNGKVWKSRSIIGDYSSFYHYTPDGGSVDGWKFYVGGKLNYEQVFTYLPPHHKMPLRARPGIKYDFISSNGWWGSGRWWSTSEKDISYDENGENPVVFVDQDPTRTIVETNCNNYPTITNFFDVLTQDYIHFKFTYENCCDGKEQKPATAQKSLPLTNRQINPIQFLRFGSAKSVKEQIRELRQQHLNKR